MADDTTQRKAFDFLRALHLSQEPFKLEDFMAATGWTKPGTFRTYLGKQYRGLIEQVGPDTYRVTDAFWRVNSWRKFRAHVSQVRPIVTNYTPNASRVLIYDFLMPLSNEEPLRTTLDALFYKDRLLARLKTLGSTEVSKHFPNDGQLSDKEYFDRVLDFIEDRFVGYSISHVDGRFRAAALRTQDEAATLQMEGERYLIDETTAVARFIFPYADEEELDKVRFLFTSLFVRSILQLVGGEEQIWMVESGSAGSQLHIWQRANED